MGNLEENEGVQTNEQLMNGNETISHSALCKGSSAPGGGKDLNQKLANHRQRTSFKLLIEKFSMKTAGAQDGE